MSTQTQKATPSPSTWTKVRRVLSNLSPKDPHTTTTSNRLYKKPQPSRYPSQKDIQILKQQLANFQARRSKDLQRTTPAKTHHAALIEESYFSLYGLNRNAADGAWHCMSCDTRNQIIRIPSSAYPVGFLKCRECHRAWTTRHPSTNILIPQPRGADGVVCSSCGLSHARNYTGTGDQWVRECICSAHLDASWTFFKFGNSDDYRTGNPDAVFLKEFERRKALAKLESGPKPEEGKITIGFSVLVPEYSAPSPSSSSSPHVYYNRGERAGSGGSNGSAASNSTGKTVFPDAVSTFTQMPNPQSSTSSRSHYVQRHDSVHQPTLSPSAQREAFANRAYKVPTAKRWPAAPPTPIPDPRNAPTSRQPVYKTGAEVWKQFHEDSFARREWQRGRDRGDGLRDVHPALRA